MRYLLVAAAKDIRRRLADPASFAFWIALPLLLGGLLSLALSDGGAPPRATVLVVDEDRTFVSGLLTTALGRAPIMDLQPVTLDEGRRRVGDGDATALLVVPAGFQQAVLGDSAAELTLLTNPAEQILPGIVEESLEIAVEGVFYAQQIFGPVLRRIASGGAGPPSDADVAAISVEINQTLTSLQNVVIPPAIALTIVREAPEQAGPSLTLGQLFFPGMLFMSFLFIAGAMAGDIWEEQQMGRLAALGGCWWPIEITPRWMQALALVLPSGWTMDALHKLVNFGFAPVTAVPHVAVLGAAALVAGWGAAKVFRYQ